MTRIKKGKERKGKERKGKSHKIAIFHVFVGKPPREPILAKF